MAKKDLAFGQRAIRRILRELDKPEELEQSYAAAILKQAKQNAASKPTPQARMAASVLVAEGGNIFPSGSAGTPEVDVGIGSEFGSAVWPQFHAPPNPRGYWLYPATRDSQVLGKADKTLEEVLQEAARGMGF